MRWATQCRFCLRRASGQTTGQQLSPQPERCMQFAELVETIQPRSAAIGSLRISLQVAQVAGHDCGIGVLTDGASSCQSCIVVKVPADLDTLHP